MSALPRVSAVSFLNTSPLVWGFLHGPQRGSLDLRCVLPSECADDLKEDRADVGLVPIIELARQRDLSIIPGSAIACVGPVRSILLISKRPLGQMETLAADSASRTSVVLSQLVLRSSYSVDPEVVSCEPLLDDMLTTADAALVIGDPALRLDPEMKEWRGQRVNVWDMGAEWVRMTGLPMVFAVWASKRSLAPEIVETFARSKAYGLSRIDEIVERESAERGFGRDLVRRYITQHVAYDLGARERMAIERYLGLAAESGLAPNLGEPRYVESAAVASRN